MSSADDVLGELQRYLDAMHIDLQEACNSVTDPDMRGQLETYARQVADAKQNLVSDYQHTMAELDQRLKKAQQSSEETLKRVAAARKKSEEAKKTEQSAAKAEAQISKQVKAAKGQKLKDETLGPRLRQEILQRYALQPAAEGTLKPHVPRDTANDWEDWFQESWDG